MGSVAHAPVRQLVHFAPLGAMSLVARAPSHIRPLDVCSGARRGDRL